MILRKKLHFRFYSNHIFRRVHPNIAFIYSYKLCVYAFIRLKTAMKPYSQMVPRTRITRLLDYNKRVQNSTASVEVLKEWNLDLDRKLVEVDGHRLKPETLLFGENRTHT